MFWWLKIIPWCFKCAGFETIIKPSWNCVEVIQPCVLCSKHLILSVSIWYLDYLILWNMSNPFFLWRNGVIAQCLQPLPLVLPRYSIELTPVNEVVTYVHSWFRPSRLKLLFSVSLGCRKWSHYGTPSCHVYCSSWRSISCQVHFWKTGRSQTSFCFTNCAILLCLAIVSHWVYLLGWLLGRGFVSSFCCSYILWVLLVPDAKAMPKSRRKFHLCFSVQYTTLPQIFRRFIFQIRNSSLLTH